VQDVSMWPDKDFFIVSQLNGVVQFKSLRKYGHLCYLNDPLWNIAFWQ